MTDTCTHALSDITEKVPPVQMVLQANIPNYMHKWKFNFTLRCVHWFGFFMLGCFRCWIMIVLLHFELNMVSELWVLEFI